MHLVFLLVVSVFPYFCIFLAMPFVQHHLPPLQLFLLSFLTSCIYCLAKCIRTKKYIAWLLSYSKMVTVFLNFGAISYSMEALWKLKLWQVNDHCTNFPLAKRKKC